MKTISLYIVAASLMTPLALASTCRDISQRYEFSNQAELLASLKLNGSKTICGTLYFRKDFSGPFNLPGISTIKGSISGPWTPNPEDNSVPGVTSIVLEDLVEFGGLELHYMPSLKFVSMPKLKYGGDLSIAGTSNAISLDFPSLRTASGINLHAKFSSISIPLLKNLGIEDNSFKWDTSNRIESTTEVDISFPSLIKSSTLEIIGAVKSLSLPSLSYVNGDFYISSMTSQALNITLPALGAADNIVIRGYLSELNLPALRNVSGSFAVTNSLRTICKETEKRYTNVSKSFTCHDVNPPKKRLSVGQKVAIGVGSVGAGLVVVGFGLVFFLDCRKRKKSRLRALSDKQSVQVMPEHEADAASLVGSDRTLTAEIGNLHDVDQTRYLRHSHEGFQDEVNDLRGADQTQESQHYEDRLDVRVRPEAKTTHQEV